MYELVYYDFNISRLSIRHIYTKLVAAHLIPYINIINNDIKPGFSIVLRVIIK